MTTSPYINPLKMTPPVIKIEKRNFPLRWVLFIDHSWKGAFPTKKSAIREVNNIFKKGYK
jgi:hypothetical protein